MYYGGYIISVPVSHFNNAGGWKKQFNYPNHTYVVSHVAYHDLAKEILEVCFLGAKADDTFTISIKAYHQFRKLWLSHGCRRTPTYEINPPKKTFSLLEDDNDPYTPLRPRAGQ